MPQKYVVVSFIDISTVPDEFASKSWPLHVTLLPLFQIPKIEKLSDEMADYSRNTKPFRIKMDGGALFGVNKDIAVTLIGLNKEIEKLHIGLLRMAKKCGAIFDSPQFMGDGFRPHITVQDSTQLSENNFNVSNFTLVDMFPGGDINRRKIINTYKFRE